MLMDDFNDKIEIRTLPYDKEFIDSNFDIDKIVFDLDKRIKFLSSNADNLDILVSAGSGLICGLLDIVLVGEFNLERGRDLSSQQINEFVLRTSEMLGYNGDDIQGAVRFLESNFKIPSDSNTPNFGGGLQHHLRDFAHHPTMVGLLFSLLTQFTCKAFGASTDGNFLVVDVKSKEFIGKNIQEKIFFGTIIWFFHLVSDMAGSNKTVANCGGTGIPGPILSLAKEMSALPFFNQRKNDNELTIFLSKLFNGTLLAKKDSNNIIIKGTEIRFDLRAEMGVVFELGRQSLPVIANECIVRSFYLIRRLAIEIMANKVDSIEKFVTINWDKIKPYNNSTITRMLLVSSTIFTSVDIAGSCANSCILEINVIGVGRFLLAINSDMAWLLKRRDIELIKKVYLDIKKNTYDKQDNALYERIGIDMTKEKLGLTIEQTEILYNIEYYKVYNDIDNTNLIIGNDKIKKLKFEWLEEWKNYITNGFSSFIQVEGSNIKWYSKGELIKKVEDSQPEQTWLKLVLLEAMLFTPYYPLGLEKNDKGDDIPSKKYNSLKNVINGFNNAKGDEFLDSLFVGKFYKKGFIKRLRSCYSNVVLEMKEVIKSILLGGAVTAAIAIVTIATAGALAPAIAVALVGSNFSGLAGAALTSASLAYIGGGAVAVGGAGMAGGIITIVGGGALLGIGAGAGVGGALSFSSMLGKQNIINQSAKLLVSMREIFINDEHDLEFSDTVFEEYLENIISIENELVKLRLKLDESSSEERKEIKKRIKTAEDSVKAMKIARKNYIKFKSSVETGVKEEN